MPQPLAQRLSTAVRRWRHHEFWPAWLFYLPLIPWCGLLSIRHRSVLAFLAANPGIEKGGGWVNESKASILEGLRASAAGRSSVLAHRLIPAGAAAEARAAHAARLIEGDAELGGYPVILKPDAGQRGFAVRLAQRAEHLLPYFQANTRAVLLQKYHAGPHECGILWVRSPLPSSLGAADGASADRPPLSPPRGRGNASAASGFIFAITRKTFPVIEGDGRSTLRELVLKDDRLRCQSTVFFSRWADQLTRVLGEGERLRLAEAGNHCQGTVFSDGSDLVTPALEAVIDEIAGGFHGPDGDGQRSGHASPLDFGRFDLRYDSDELLRQGQGFAIVELNGTSSEATNLYDPSRGLVWAYGILFRQWAHLYRLGAARVREGWPRMSLANLHAEMRAQFENRPGSPISD
ncbi:MAG: hypothetical protein ACKVS8_13615 [Phycisphaerales bacterium]